MLDIEHPRQSGITTRPIEMLPMQKKVITTNQTVKSFDFYNENNFCIIDCDHLNIDNDFWELPYIPADKSVIERYSPMQFIKTIFQEDPEVYNGED